MVIVVAIIVVIVIVIVVAIVIVIVIAFVIVVGVVIVIVVIDIIDVTVPLRIAVVVVVPAVMVVAAMAILGSIDRVLVPTVGVDGRRLGGHGVGVLDGRRSSAASASTSNSASASAAASAPGRAVRAADHPHAVSACTCTGCRRIEALERIQAVVVARRGTAAVIAAARSTSGTRPLSSPAGPRFRPAPRHDRAGPADPGTASAAAVAAAVAVAAARARHCIYCIQFAPSLSIIQFGSKLNIEGQLNSCWFSPARLVT